ncbi:MAG: helix-turn-helix domain-containing protein [Myxococcota bacterium]
MLIAPQPPALEGPVHLHFDDIAELGRAIPWDIDFRQLDSGSPSIVASVVESERVSAMSFAFSNAYHQLGFAPRGALTFGVPSGPLDWYAHEVDGSRVLSFNDASGFDCVSRDRFSGTTLSISPVFVQDASARLGIEAEDALFAERSGIVFGDREHARALRSSLVQLLRSSDPADRKETEWEIVRHLLLAARPEDPALPSVLPRQRARAIARAIDYIEANPHRAVQVREICEHTGVSWRTLDRAFSERFGIGPKAYLEQRRLAAVRAILTQRGRTVTIADAANEWGFWHMGQFARDYRRAFGELPSETLAKR